MSNKVQLDVSLVFSRDIWHDETGFERDFAVFLKSKGLEGSRMVNPARMSIEVVPKSSSFPTVVPENKSTETPTSEVKQQIGDYSSLLDTLKKATPAKPKIRVFRESIL